MTNKEQILTTALQLFADKGYSGTSTSLIARETGVSEALIFRHYTSKEGLLKAILETGVEHIRQSLVPLMKAKPGLKDLDEYLLLFSRLIQKHYSFWKLMSGLRFQEDVKKVLEQQFGFVNKKIIKQLVTLFKNLGDKNPALQSLCFFAQLDGTVMHYALFGPAYPLEEVLNEMRGQLRRRYSD